MTVTPAKNRVTNSTGAPCTGPADFFLHKITKQNPAREGPTGPEQGPGWTLVIHISVLMVKPSDPQTASQSNCNIVTQTHRYTGHADIDTINI